MQRIAFIALREQRLVTLVAVELGTRSDRLEHRQRHPRRETTLYGPHHEQAVDHGTHRFNRVHELHDVAARRLDEHALATSVHGRRAAAAGQQAALTKELASAECDTPRRAILADLDLHLALEDGIEGVGVVVAAEHHLAGLRPMHRAAQHQLAEHQRIHFGE